MKFSMPKFLEFKGLTLKNNIAIGYIVSILAVLTGLGSTTITLIQKNNLFLLAIGFTVLAVIMLRFFKRSLNVINTERRKDDRLNQTNDRLTQLNKDLQTTAKQLNIKMNEKDGQIHTMETTNKSLTKKVDDLTSQLAVAIANAKPVKKPAKRKTAAKTTVAKA